MIKEEGMPMPVDHIPRSIQNLRGQRVLLDSDLEAVYGVETSRIFPPDSHSS